MRFVLFCHSVISDWNNGNAHFLRGVIGELSTLGHTIGVFEPAEGWSRTHLVTEYGNAALEAIEAVFPNLQPTLYGPGPIDLDQALEGADVVLVHEWNDPSLVAQIGAHRRQGGKYRLFFHDTHHRSLTLPEAMGRYDLDGYDGVLAFGEAIREIYLRRGWTRRVWTWHEAADVAVFRPDAAPARTGDLVWVGNWGDEERAAELAEFLLEPVRALALRAVIHGVRYPEHALAAIRAAGASYRGWLANHLVPATFASYPVTVHVPRRPYAEHLPGIPTIRVFEALACGIPLICAPWEDAEGLFRPGSDYLVAEDGAMMQRHLRMVLNDRDLAAALAASGLETIVRRHTCRHRALELIDICRTLGCAGEANDISMEVA